MALDPTLLRQLQSDYGQQMKGPMGDAAFDDGTSIKPRDNPNVAGGVASAVGLGVNAYAQATRNKNINTAAPASQVDSSGKPTYNLGSFAQQAGSINTNINAGNILNSTAQGAVAGSAIPVIGTAVGAIGGFAIGLGSELFASDSAKRKKRLAQQSLFAAQRAYNSSISQYNNMLSGEQQYNDLQNPDARLYNLYKSTTQPS